MIRRTQSFFSMGRGKLDQISLAPLKLGTGGIKGTDGCSSFNWMSGQYLSLPRSGFSAYRPRPAARRRALVYRDIGYGRPMRLPADGLGRLRATGHVGRVMAVRPMTTVV